MRVVAVKVGKLFGIFNHSIRMQMDERVTIIHAENGFGKTTILKMVNGLFTGRFSDLETVPFESFEVRFDDGSSLLIRHSHEENDGAKHHELRVQHSDGFGNVKRTQVRTLDPREADFPLSIIDDIVPDLTRIGQTSWRSLETGAELSFSDVVTQYGHMLPVRFSQQKVAPWLQELTQQVKVRFIESQRLFRPSRNPRSHPRSDSVEPAVAFYSQQIAREINRVFGEYGQLSQTLDQSFPRRLVEHLENEPSPTTSPLELNRRIAALDDVRRRLRDAGLLEQEEVAFSIPTAFQQLAQQVLPLYVNDVERKLSSFAQLLEKIELLKKIVTERFKYKTVTISKEKGFTFESQGEPLSPTFLSSGEQQILVLWSELIFLVEPNSLVLIDEPEISLHVGWQQDFLRQLLQLTKITDFDVLLATHSPQIISDRWDLTVGLDGPEWPR